VTVKELVLEELNVPVKLLTQRMFVIQHKHHLPIMMLIAPVEGISAKEIADALGIAESTLSEWRKRFGMEDVRTLKPGPKVTQKG